MVFIYRDCECTESIGQSMISGYKRQNPNFNNQVFISVMTNNKYYVDARDQNVLIFQTLIKDAISIFLLLSKI